jgi:hypothetical protein
MATQRSRVSVKAAQPERGARTPRRSRIRAIRPAQRQRDDRRTAIAKVLALWPQELADESVDGRERIMAKLRQALRAERRRGLCGHWTYDLARHVELLRIYREELAAAAGRKDVNSAFKLPVAVPAARGKC